MSGREPEFAEFAPERLTGGRSRRLDPLAIGAAVVVVGFAVAIVKPWGVADPGLAAQASEAPAAAAIGPAASLVAREPAVTGPADGPIGLREPPVGWNEAVDVVRDHEAWGIRTLIDDPEPGGSDAVERWAALPGSGRSPDGPEVVLPSDAEAILALGLTFPAGDVPLDARIWRAVGDGWEWLAADPLAADGAGAFLFAPPKVAGGYLPTWPTGRYRIEWLADDGIGTATIRVEGRFETGRASLVSLRPPDRTLPSPLTPDFAVADDERLFAVTRGVAAGLPGSGSIPLDAAAAWRQALDVRDELPPAVAMAYLPEANGLGVLLPTGTSGADGDITRLGPNDAVLDAQRSVGIHFAEGGRSPYVIFRAPGGATWQPGVYRLDVTWQSPAGPRTASYHLELRPAPTA